MVSANNVGVLTYAESTAYRAQKALIAAKFNGLVVDKKIFDPEKDGKTPDFAQKNPMGKVPFLSTEGGCISSSNAIAKYIARVRGDNSLLGKCFDDEGTVDSLLEFSLHELEVPLMHWVYPVMGLMEEPPAASKTQAQADVKSALQFLEARLASSDYLVGDFVSLADIVLVCALREGFERVFDPSFRKPYPKVCAWFERCCALPQFKAVLGEVKLCTQAQVAKPVAAAAGKNDKGGGKKPDKADKKASPKSAPAPDKKASPKSAPAPAPGGAVDEAAVKAVADELRELKEKLKGEGLTGKKLNEHADIKVLIDKLTALKGGEDAPKKQAAPKKGASPKAAPKADPKGSPKGGAVGEAAVKALGDELRVLKEKLKGEGVTGKKLNEHAEVKALVEKLAAAKTGGGSGEAKAAAAPAGSDEDRKKKLKNVIKEGGKRGVEIEGAADMGGLRFFSTSVDEPEGDIDLLVESMKAMNNQPIPGDEERKGCSGHIGKAIFSAGVEQLAIAAYVPEAEQDNLNCKEWLQAILADFGGEVLLEGKDICTGRVKTDGNKNIFPLKIREPMIFASNNFLRNKSLFPQDDSDDDEMVFGDDDFPS